MAQHQFARAQRQDHRDDDVERTRGRSCGETCSARPRNEHEQRAEGGHRQSAERFQHHVPMARQKKGGHEVPVQKPLIRDQRAREERGSDRNERDLGSYPCHEIFEPLPATPRSHIRQ